jgi:diguanylate cyclase (GGDEF)-like protein
MKSYKFIWPYILLVAFIIFLIVMGVVYSGRYRLSLGEPLVFDNLYYYQSDSEDILLDNLPVELDVPINTNYMVYTILDDDFVETNHILIRSSLANVTVYLDGIMIYNFDYEDHGAYASMWHVVDIPADQEGTRLEIRFSSPYVAMSGTVNPIYYGETSALYNEIFQLHSFRFIVGVLTLFIGIVIMGVSLIFFRKQNLNNMFIGLFAILFSLWLISESRMLQFFIGNVYILGAISYLVLPLFPIPLLYYIKNTVIVKEKGPIRLMMTIFVLDFIFILIAHETGILDYFESVIITLNIFALSFIALIGIMFYEYKMFDNKRSILLLKIMAVLLVFAVLELVVFVLGSFDFTSVFATIGIVIVMSIILTNYAKFFLQRLKLSYEKEFYEKLAYIDPLTKSGNRLAFNETFEKYYQDESRRKKLRLIYFDLNNLKTINDEYGHLSGDEAIINITDIIEMVFKNHADCFRIGGDEFACLSSTIDEGLYDRYKRLFLNEMYNKNHSVIYPFSAAVGSITYDEVLDKSINDMMRRCDLEMYKHKKVMKEDK